MIFFLWRKTKSARTYLLLTGLSESGKTYLFSQLLYSIDKETFSSISTNIGDYHSNDNNGGPIIKFVDIPGNERLRNKFFDEFKYLARGIIYVIDSVTFQKDVKDVADYLYTILADQQSIPILILCNKQDETMAKSSVVIKNLLEKELNLVRTTRCSSLQSVDNSQVESVFLGKHGVDFTFEQLSQNIQLVECSAKNRDFKELTNWIQKV